MHYLMFRRAVLCSLNLNSISIAIPAIGTGIYRLPATQAIESIVHTVLLYLQENRPATKIDRIVFFDHDSSKAEAFAQCLIATSQMTSAPQRAAEALQAS
jgi:O-acetyl-ADP-ribose deacetylase (regulator of RNase III)